jgi:hypothetical protein
MAVRRFGTVIALIFYNGGVLVVADSRTTMIRTYSPDGIHTKVDIRYDDTANKIKMSKDKDVIVAMAGDAAVDTKASKAVADAEADLKKQSVAGNKSVEGAVNRVISGMAGYGQALLLIAFRGNDGKIYTKTADVAPPGLVSNGASTKLKDINKSLARGTDNTVPVYLDSLIAKYSPDDKKRDLADAMALAFMLESKYMKYQVEIYGKKAIVVGGPIKMHAIDNDRNKDTDVVVDKNERKQIEGMTYKQLRDYFADRLKNQKKNVDMLRIEPEDSLATDKIIQITKEMDRQKGPWKLQW